jgi:hypothetical protein
MRGVGADSIVAGRSEVDYAHRRGGPALRRQRADAPALRVHRAARTQCADVRRIPRLLRRRHRTDLPHRGPAPTRHDASPRSARCSPTRASTRRGCFADLIAADTRTHRRRTAPARPSRTHRPPRPNRLRRRCCGRSTSCAPSNPPMSSNGTRRPSAEGADGSVPIEALSAAVLDEPAPNAAGAMRWALAQAGLGRRCDSLLAGVDDPSAAGADPGDPRPRRGPPHHRPRETSARRAVSARSGMPCARAWTMRTTR